MEEYTVVAGKRLRKGYTTGTCAAIAAGGAARMLLKQNLSTIGTVILPQGKEVTLPLVNCQISLDEAVAGVIKDGGDDPDVTTGLIIYARVSWSKTLGVQIVGGQGVGVVSRKGLQIPPGEVAINPIPRQMIIQAVTPFLIGGQGMCVEIFVPGGEVVAQKTFNPQLGIVGGISILGTTGIVEPMSEEAYRVSLALKVHQLGANGITFGVLVLGNYGEEVAIKEYGINQEQIIKTSNFIGYLLDACVEQGLKKVLLIGHLGKLIKVAGGIFYTHNRVADCRQEIMAGFAAKFGASQEVIAGIFDATTTEEMVEILNAAGLDMMYSWLAERVAERCIRYVYGSLEVEVVLYTFAHGVLSESTGVQHWYEEGWRGGTR